MDQISPIISNNTGPRDFVPVLSGWAALTPCFHG